MFGLFKKNNLEIKSISVIGLTPKEDGTVMERNLYYANKGGVLFNYYVGRDYAFGVEKGDVVHPDGVEPDVNKALHYLTYAAEREIRDAQTIIGLIFMGEFGDEYINEEESLKWINRAACAGDSKSQHLLATMYRTGSLVEKDDELAYKWTLESATRGSEASMMDLCDYYRDKLTEFPEEMTTEEENEFYDCIWLSYKWGRIAAEYEEPRGMFMTGVAFFNGFGVEEDKEEARKFFEMAAKHGYEEAKEFLAENF